jgi:hypothetical protein
VRVVADESERMCVVIAPSRSLAFVFFLRKVRVHVFDRVPCKTFHTSWLAILGTPKAVSPS